MRERIPVVVLGCRHPHAAGRTARLVKVEEAELVGCWDDDSTVAEALASAHAVPVFEGPEECLDRARGGLVLIESASNKRSAELATMAADAGVAMLLEKPGAHRPEALRALREHVTARDVFCQVGYHMRYGPSIDPAVRACRDGTLGTVTTGRFHAAVQSPWLASEWFTDPDDLGGLLYVDACHIVDLLVHLLGAPEEVICRMHQVSSMPEHRFEDSAALILRFGDTLLAGDVCGWESNDWVETWDVQFFGNEGTLDLRLHPPRCSIWSPGGAGKGERGWTTHEYPQYDGEENYERELRDVIRRVRDRLPPGGATLDDAVIVADALGAAYRDAEAAS